MNQCISVWLVRAGVNATLKVEYNKSKLHFLSEHITVLL